MELYHYAISATIPIGENVWEPRGARVPRPRLATTSTNRPRKPHIGKVTTKIAIKLLVIAITHTN